MRRGYNNGGYVSFRMASTDDHPFQNELLEWSKGNLRKFPWRTTSDPYKILIAELLLRRTFAAKVEPIYETFVSEYPDFDAVAAADDDELREIIRPLGLQNQRVNVLRKVAGRLRDRPIQSAPSELMNVPHVGKYAAHAVSCFGYGQAQPIFDTNVQRVYGRVFDLDQSRDQRDEEQWAFAEDILPEEDAQTYNLALLDFAAEICTAQSPACDKCFARRYCDYYLPD